jgi:hypothetical protein
MKTGCNRNQIDRKVQNVLSRLLDCHGYNMTWDDEGVSGIVISKESYERVSRDIKENQYVKGRICPKFEKKKIIQSYRKLTAYDFLKISESSKSGISDHELTKQYHCSYSTIRRMLRGAYKL